MKFKPGKRVRKFQTRPKYLGAKPENTHLKTKLLTWGQKLATKAKSLCSKKGSVGSGYLPVGTDPDQGNGPPVSKNHLAVYVGQKDSEFRRVLVPVVYFNHPLFGELLKETEKEYGFCHQGGITIPCRVTEFERVKTRIASGSGLRRLGRQRY